MDGHNLDAFPWALGKVHLVLSGRFEDSNTHRLLKLLAKREKNIQ
jgi:hypothetical protein